jgi:hypothetical protein
MSKKTIEQLAAEAAHCISENHLSEDETRGYLEEFIRDCARNLDLDEVRASPSGTGFERGDVLETVYPYTRGVTRHRWIVEHSFRSTSCGSGTLVVVRREGPDGGHATLDSAWFAGDLGGRVQPEAA